MFNKLKGLQNGFFHTWQCGNYTERNLVYNQSYKDSVTEGKFNRFITNAPRDARYKIDYYYNNDTKPEYTVPYPYLNFHGKLLTYLGIDETFNWKERLVDNKEECTFGDFTIGYGSFDSKLTTSDISHYFDKEFEVTQFYFKYKGDINTLLFNYAPQLVDYSNEFWSNRKNKIVTYSDVATLLHNMGYFILYNKINI